MKEGLKNLKNALKIAGALSFTAVILSPQKRPVDVELYSVDQRKSTKQVKHNPETGDITVRTGTTARGFIDGVFVEVRDFRTRENHHGGARIQVGAELTELQEGAEADLPNQWHAKHSTS